MADISPQRINIQVEEVDYKSAISEATGSRIGSSINFVNERQYDSRGFFLNGPYSQGGVQSGVDGAWGILFNVELVGCMMFNLVAGSSGTTTLDVHRFSASGADLGSIFATRPAISFSAGNNAFVFNRSIDSTTLENPTGTTLPVFSTTNLNAGDMLVLNQDAVQASAENCGLLLYYRPR